MALPYDWRHRTLAKIGAPRNDTNVMVLTLWAASEGTPTTWHNWLATTRDCCGGTPVNSAGVRAYPNLDMGVEATAGTLMLPAYRGIVAALRAGAGATRAWQAIHDSPWCRGCQGGWYPVVLAQHLGLAGPSKEWEANPQPPPPENPTAPTDIDFSPGLDALAAYLQAATQGFTAVRVTLDRLTGLHLPKEWRP